MNISHTNPLFDGEPKPLLDGMDSESVRTRQMAMVERFKDASSHMGLDLLSDEKLFPPEDVIERINLVWRDKRNDPEQRGAEKISLCDVTRRSIFSRTRVNSDKNDGYLLSYDPGVMPLVKAMIDEYVLCEHWDQMGAASITEGVRAQVADHYSRLLMERGYKPEQALKVIGNAIKAYLSIANRMQWNDASAILPFKTGKPASEIISEIQAHGRLSAEEQKLFTSK